MVFKKHFVQRSDFSMAFRERIQFIIVKLASSHVTILHIHPQSLPRELMTYAVIFQPCSMTHVVCFTIFFFKTELLIRRKPFVKFLLHFIEQHFHDFRVTLELVQFIFNFIIDNKCNYQN